MENIKRFDMQKRPVRCSKLLMPVAWMLGLGGKLGHKAKITKIGMKGVKPPYLLLCNHNAFLDMKISVMATYPHIGNYIVAIDGFIGREGLLRSLGCICKRKFTNDISVYRNITHAIKLGDIVIIYPEARYSLCGTTAPLPAALGGLSKKLGIPVVTLMCHGHHINHPFWNTSHERGVKPTSAEMKLLFTPEDLKELSADEINQALVKEFKYDDFAWQKENKIKVDCPDRAVYLDKILYQCPHCKKEYRMSSSGDTLRCDECGKEWVMDEYGSLSAKEGETEFSHIPDWYEWERANVKAEVAKGQYSSGQLSVSVESLPNADKFIPLGKGVMTHDMNGFRVTVKGEDGKEYTMIKKVPELYSCHIEYNYLFTHGDCVDLNTLEDTWYVYPDGKDFSVTKMALATEELYYDWKRKNGKEIKEGLA